MNKHNGVELNRCDPALTGMKPDVSSGSPLGLGEAITVVIVVF